MYVVGSIVIFEDTHSNKTTATDLGLRYSKIVQMQHEKAYEAISWNIFQRL